MGPRRSSSSDEPTMRELKCRRKPAAARDFRRTAIPPAGSGKVDGNVSRGGFHGIGVPSIRSGFAGLDDDMDGRNELRGWLPGVGKNSFDLAPLHLGAVLEEDEAVETGNFSKASLADIAAGTLLRATQEDAYSVFHLPSRSGLVPTNRPARPRAKTARLERCRSASTAARSAGDHSRCRVPASPRRRIFA